MEVQFEPDVQAKLDQMARESGRAAAEFVKDVVTGYLDDLAGTGEMLNSRYDDIKSGRVKLIPGDEVFARLRQKSEALRAKSGS
jgi:predicted DNA-binding protein